MNKKQRAKRWRRSQQERAARGRKINRKRKGIRKRVQRERPGHDIRWVGGVLYDLTKASYRDHRPSEVFCFRNGQLVPSVARPGKEVVGWEGTYPDGDGPEFNVWDDDWDPEFDDEVDSDEWPVPD